MGRGLGSLQSKILAMANVNRKLDGLEIARPTVYLELPIDRDAISGYCLALHRLRDLASRTDIVLYDKRGFARHDARYVHNALIDTVLGEAGDTAESPFERFDRALRATRRVSEELIDGCGLDLRAEDGVDDWEESVRSWKLSSHDTALEAMAAEAALKAKGVPGEFLSCKFVGSKSHLRTPEILADVYGFRPYLMSEKDRASRRLFPKLLFDRGAIGERRYNAASVAVSKAVRALYLRDMAAPHERAYLPDSLLRFSGHLSITLTAEGVDRAEDIMAKMPYILQDLSLYQMQEVGR